MRDIQLTDQHGVIKELRCKHCDSLFDAGLILRDYRRMNDSLVIPLCWTCGFKFMTTHTYNKKCYTFNGNAFEYVETYTYDGVDELRDILNSPFDHNTRETRDWFMECIADKIKEDLEESIREELYDDLRGDVESQLREDLYDSVLRDLRRSDELREDAIDQLVRDDDTVYNEALERLYDDPAVQKHATDRLENNSHFQNECKQEAIEKATKRLVLMRLENEPAWERLVMREAVKLYAKEVREEAKKRLNIRLIKAEERRKNISRYSII